jgi:hypothetical protein
MAQAQQWDWVIFFASRRSVEAAGNLVFAGGRAAMNWNKKIKTWMWAAVLVCGSRLAGAQTSAVNGYCNQGATSAVTSGLKSANYLQGQIPQCTVTVYLTGTVNLATIYSDGAGGTLTNPFTASGNASYVFYAANGIGLDVTKSGGIPPNVYQAPVTDVDVIPGGGSGGGGGSVEPGNTNQAATYPSSGTTVSGSSSLNLASTIRAVGVQDNLVKMPYYTWVCGLGASDEGTATDNCVATDISNGVKGRTYAPSTNASAVTWVESPFAALSVSSGQPPELGSFQLRLVPNLTVTTDAEVDLGFDSLLDCGNGYAGGGGPGSAGTYILPEASGYPTSTLIGLGSLATNATAFAVQGSKLVNCGLSANGRTGMTAVDESQVQEGAKAVNNRMFGFQICFNDDANATDGGAFHFWGNFDNQCEMGDNTDSTVWGARYGYNKQGVEAGIIQNFSAIAGANSNGTVKIGVENDSSGLSIFNMTTESLTYGVLNNAAHSSGKSGNLFVNVGCSPANSASSICGEDDNAGPDWGSIWMNIQGANTDFLQLNEPRAVVRSLHGDPGLGFYAFDAAANTGNATVLTNSPQVANSNLKFGDSYPNLAAWPSVYLPAKTVTLTIGGQTFIADEYMTTSDVSAGTLPDGVASNGDPAAETSAPHSMALVRTGPVPVIFDGATTANDWAVLSTGTVIGSAVGAHDSGSTLPPASGGYLGKIGLSVAAAPPAPTAPTITTTCSGTCATTYSYCWVQKATMDPVDGTQSACSTAGTVSGSALLTFTSYNTISACTTASGTSPCELYETAGPSPGWLVETISSATTVKDNGLIGVTIPGLPSAVGIIAPPVHMEMGATAIIPDATNSSTGLVQCDGSTIVCNSGGVVTTGPGAIMPYYWNSQGNSTGVSFSIVANSQYAIPYPITAQVTFKELCVNVNTLDSGGGLYGLALVKLTVPSCTGAACAATTEAHWSAQTLSATGPFCAANAEGTVTVTPGMYYMVTTGSATTAQWSETNASNTQFSPLTDASAGTSSGGVFGTITLDVLTTGGVHIISGAGGPIWAGLSQ